MRGASLMPRSTMRALLFSLALAFAVLAGQAGGAEKRNITEKDLFDFVWIGDPQVSPDGSQVAFVRVSVNEKKEGYDTSIWMVPTTGDAAPHRITTGNARLCAALVAGWEVSRVCARDGEGRETGAGSARDVADDGRRCFPVYFVAEGRGRNRLVAGWEDDRVYERHEPGGSGETGEEEAEGRGIEESDRGGARSGGEAGAESEPVAGGESRGREQAGERCACDHAGGLSLEQRGLSRSETAGPYLDDPGAAHGGRESGAEAIDERPLR